MKTLVIGTGAAGNKAAINLVKCNIVDKDDILLLNSTLTDIPEIEKFEDRAIKFSEELEGCAKEREAGKYLAIGSIIRNDEKLNFERIVEGYEKVIIVTSLEGGTGSGTSIVIADHLANQTNVKIELYLFKGFSKDIIGLQNTVSFFTDLANCKKTLKNRGLEDNYRVQIIRNDAFLNETKDELEAQQLANNEFAKRVMISSGSLLNGKNNNDCSNNIDDSELLKVTCAPGYGTIEYIDVKDEILSEEEYDNLVKEMINSTKSLPIEQVTDKNQASAKYISIFGNLQKNSRANVDYKQKVLKEKFGDIPVLFDQFYTDSGGNEFLALMIGGANMPKNSIESIIKEYNKRSKFLNDIDNSDDDFINIMESVKIDNSSFNILTKKKSTPPTNNTFTSTFSDMYKDMFPDAEKNNKKTKSQKLDPPNASDY